MKFNVPFSASELVQMIGGPASFHRTLQEASGLHARLARLLAPPAMSDLFHTLGSLEYIQRERERMVDSCRQQIDLSQSQWLAQEALGSLGSAVEAARLAGSLVLPHVLDSY